MNKMKKGLTALFAIAVIIASGIQAKAQHPDVVYRVTFRNCVVFIAQTGDFGRRCLSYLGAGYDVVQQHFPDEIYLYADGSRLHVPEGGSVKNVLTDEDVTWEFRMEEEMDFQFGD